MDPKNDTQSKRIAQGISRNIEVVDNKDTKADTLPKQYGKMPFGITPHLTKLSAKALLLYVDLSQLFWGDSNSLSLTTNPITDDGLAKRTGFSLAKTAHARRELVDSGVVEIIKTAHADSGKLKRVFRFYQAGEIGEGKPQLQLAEQTGDPQITNVTSGSPEASNSSNRTEAYVQNEQHHVFKMDNTMCSKRTNQNQQKKSAKPDGDSVSAIDSQEPLLVLPTSNIPTTTTKADEWIEQQTYWSQKMGGTLAELHDHIKREFKLSDAYACRVMDALGKDKGGINYPQGYMNHQDGIAHLAKIAQAVQQEIKEQVQQEQAKREEVNREEAKQQRKLEWEERQTVFQGLRSQIEKGVQNSIKGVSIDSSAHPYPSDETKPLEGKIDTFLSDSEAIEDLYHKHIGTSLDFDGVIEREETLQRLWARRVYGKEIDLKAYTEEEKPVMELYLAQQREEGCMKKPFFTESRWDWNQSGTRMGDFYDYIKRNILSDEQPQSPFVLHDMFSQNKSPKLGI